MTQLLRDDEVLWLIVDVPEELEFLQGSKSKIDFRSFHQTDPRRCRRSWPASNGRQKRNGNVRCPRHPVYRMVKMSRACRVESKRKELRNVTGVLFVSMCALLLLVNVTAQGQEESASPAPEKKSYPEVPKEYEVGEETVSPDGRFAILYPVRDEDSNVDSGLTNLLVRLRPYDVLKEIESGDGVTWKGGRGAAAARWDGNDWVAVWHQRKWSNEGLVVYQIANDKIKREKKIWPEVVKYFDRDFKARFLKNIPMKTATRLCQTKTGLKKSSSRITNSS